MTGFLSFKVAPSGEEFLITGSHKFILSCLPAIVKQKSFRVFFSQFPLRKRLQLHLYFAIMKGVRKCNGRDWDGSARRQKKEMGRPL